MNIMEYLEKMIPVEKAWPGIRQNRRAQEQLLSRMEMEIREGIAHELEDLVSPLAQVKMHGVPQSAIMPTNPAMLQQEMFRGAANVVRGKNPATEGDWEDQKRSMDERRHAQMVRGLDQMFKMPGTPEGAPAAIEHLEQLQAERREERLREWNE